MSELQPDLCNAVELYKDNEQDFAMRFENYHKRQCAPAVV